MLRYGRYDTGEPPMLRWEKAALVASASRGTPMTSWLSAKRTGRRKFRVGYFRRKLGLLTREEVCPYPRQRTSGDPSPGGNLDWSRPVNDLHAGKYPPQSVTTPFRGGY